MPPAACFAPRSSRPTKPTKPHGAVAGKRRHGASHGDATPLQSPCPCHRGFLPAAAFQSTRTEPPSSRGGEISHCPQLHRQDRGGPLVGGFHPGFPPGHRSRREPRRRRGRDDGFARALVPYYPVSFTAFRFVTQVVEIPPESITRIKDEFKDATGQSCSTFDAVTAVVFKCRALDMVLPDDAEVRLGFVASMRRTSSTACCRRWNYYGNCVYPVGITRATNAIREASLQEVASVLH